MNGYSPREVTLDGRYHNNLKYLQKQEQSDQDLHYLTFSLHLLGSTVYVKITG